MPKIPSSKMIPLLNSVSPPKILLVEGTGWGTGTGWGGWTHVGSSSSAKSHSHAQLKDHQSIHSNKLTVPLIDVAVL